MPGDLPEPFAALVREHRSIESIVEESRIAITAAANEPGDGEVALAAVEQLRDLNAFMETDLALHIAKEEDVLFPALRGLQEDDALIDDLIEQHDSVRDRHRRLQEVLSAIDDHHDEVRAEREALAANLNGDVSGETLATLRDVVARLDWILQGHFFDEEDGLFEPSVDLLAAPVLAAMAADMDALEAKFL